MIALLFFRQALTVSAGGLFNNYLRITFLLWDVGTLQKYFFFFTLSSLSLRHQLGNALCYRKSNAAGRNTSYDPIETVSRTWSYITPSFTTSKIIILLYPIFNSETVG